MIICELTKDVYDVDCYIKRGELVRCQECKHWIDDRNTEDDMGTCGLTHYFTNADDFCSYGTKDVTPRTEQRKTADYCETCNHNGCWNCVADSRNDYCVPSEYEQQTE